MKRITMEVKVGFLVVVAVVLILLFAVVKGQIPFRHASYEVRAVFKYVAGVDRGSPVRVSGVRVGEVKAVNLAYEDTPLAYVTLGLDHGVKLGRHSQILIRSFGLIGEKYVEIIPTSVTDTPLIQPGETIIGVEPLPLDRLLVLGEELGRSARDLAISMERLVGDPKLKEEIFDTLNKVQSASVQGTRTLASVEATAVELKEACTRAEDLISSAKDTVEQAKPALLRLIFNFQVASEGFVQASKQVTDILAKVQSDESSLGRLISSPDIYQKLDQSLTELNRALAQFSEASKDVASLANDVKEGKGSVGKFLTSDEIYNEVRGFMGDIRAKPWRLLRPGPR